MKVNVIVVHVGGLIVTLTRSLIRIRIPTRSPHCVAENDTIQTTELFHCFCYACKNVAFCLCLACLTRWMFVAILLEFRWIERWSSQSSLLNFFFDESRLLNFFIVFAACEKRCILLMFWLV